MSGRGREATQAIRKWIRSGRPCCEEVQAIGLSIAAEDSRAEDGLQALGGPKGEESGGESCVVANRNYRAQMAWKIT